MRGCGHTGKKIGQSKLFRDKFSGPFQDTVRIRDCPRDSGTVGNYVNGHLELLDLKVQIYVENE